MENQEQWEELGKEIVEARNDLTRSIDFDEFFPDKDRKEAAKKVLDHFSGRRASEIIAFLKTLKKFVELESRLDWQLSRDVPDVSDAAKKAEEIRNAAEELYRRAQKQCK